MTCFGKMLHVFTKCGDYGTDLVFLMVLRSTILWAQ